MMTLTNGVVKALQKSLARSLNCNLNVQIICSIMCFDISYLSLYSFMNHESITTKRRLKMSNMIICNQSTMDEVRAIAVPEITDTFFPTPHAEVITMVESYAKGILDSSFTFKDNVFGLARKGQRLFGMLTFANSDDEQELAIAYRQGYDKTLPYGVALGTSVMICNNLDLSGDIVMSKKHTLNGWDAIKATTELALKNAPTIYHKHLQDAEEMKGVEITKQRGWELLGILRGSNILKPVQLSKAFEQWDKPDYDHPTDNLWGLFNSCTEALKLESDPTNAMSRRLALHNVFTEKFVKSPKGIIVAQA